MANAAELVALALRANSPAVLPDPMLKPHSAPTNVACKNSPERQELGKVWEGADYVLILP
jgi:hypothetical protein